MRKRKAKKYQSVGPLSNYGRNTLPKGLLPGSQLVYNESAKDKMNLASQHLNQAILSQPDWMEFNNMLPESNFSGNPFGQAGNQMFTLAKQNIFGGKDNKSIGAFEYGNNPIDYNISQPSPAKRYKDGIEGHVSPSGKIYPTSPGAGTGEFDPSMFTDYTFSPDYDFGQIYDPEASNWLNAPSSSETITNTVDKIVPKDVSHMISKGENLTDIANQYGISPEELYTANPYSGSGYHLSDISKIKEGNRLNIPGQTETIQETTSQIVDSPFTNKDLLSKAPEYQGPPGGGAAGGGAAATANYLKRTGLHGALAATAGGLISKAADDQDATTLTGVETLGTLIGSGGSGASMAATIGALSPKLAAIPGLGWIGAGLGAGIGMLGAIRRKRDAKRAKKKAIKDFSKRVKSAGLGKRRAEVEAKTVSGRDMGRRFTAKLGGAIPYNSVTPLIFYKDK